MIKSKFQKSLKNTTTLSMRKFKSNLLLRQRNSPKWKLPHYNCPSVYICLWNDLVKWILNSSKKCFLHQKDLRILKASQQMIFQKQKQVILKNLNSLRISRASTGWRKQLNNSKRNFKTFRRSWWRKMTSLMIHSMFFISGIYRSKSLRNE